MKPQKCFIEISGACSAKCPYCVKGRGIQRQGRIMPVAVFDEILNYLKLNNMLPTSRLVSLYNWGEPMLHPQINEIIKTCGKYGLRASISSNLIHLKTLEKRSLHLINSVGVSLSGFSEDSYGRIHGKSFKAVLDNINRLYLMAVMAGSRWRPHIQWHRYRFNEKEMPQAKTYFNNRGMGFCPGVACLNGTDLAMDYFFDNNMSGEDRAKIEEDLFADYLEHVLTLCKSSEYECPQFSYLSIDENANLLLCCGWSNKVKQSVLGPLFDIPVDEIATIKRENELCTKCIQTGIAKFGHTDLRNQLLDDYLYKPQSVAGLSFK